MAKKKRLEWSNYQSQFLADHPLGQLHLVVRPADDEDLLGWIGWRPAVELAEGSRLLIDLLDRLAT